MRCQDRVGSTSSAASSSHDGCAQRRGARAASPARRPAPAARTARPAPATATPRRPCGGLRGGGRSGRAGATAGAEGGAAGMARLRRRAQAGLAAGAAAARCAVGALRRGGGPAALPERRSPPGRSLRRRSARRRATAGAGEARTTGASAIDRPLRRGRGAVAARRQPVVADRPRRRGRAGTAAASAIASTGKNAARACPYCADLQTPSSSPPDLAAPAERAVNRMFATADLCKRRVGGKAGAR